MKYHYTILKMCIHFVQLLSFGLLLVVLYADDYNSINEDIERMFLDYRGKYSKVNESPTSDTSNDMWENQRIFEYLFDQIKALGISPTQEQDYLLKLQNYSDFKEAVETCRRNQPQPEYCDPESPYRTFDGSCNNLEHPTLGMIGECVERLFPIFYEGSQDIRQSVLGGPLPSPRIVSNIVMNGNNTPSENVSLLFPIFGQFVAHEISYSTPSIATNSPLKCCPVVLENTNEHCDALLYEEDDEFYSIHNITCVDSTRTPPCRTCTIGRRQQPNKITPVLDGSNIYGTGGEVSNKLLTHDGTGRLVSEMTTAGELLPENHDPKDIHCPDDDIKECFKSGDKRLNQHSGLMSQHTLFMKEHNRIANRLKSLNPLWSNDKIFQESRKILGAELQVIVYKEFLPVLIGAEAMQKFDLGVGSGNISTFYNSTVRLGAFAEFSTAAFRLHTMVSQLTGYRDLAFQELYSNPGPLRKDPIKYILSGMGQVPAERYGVRIGDHLRNYLYKHPRGNYGFDMAALTIQRGRDHGLPPYVQAMPLCTNESRDIDTFDDLLKIMTPENVERLKKAYQSVEDIDLWIGIQFEKPMKGAIVGPTAGCIIAKQFYHLKYGDRFYFEHQGETPSFTLDQIEALRKVSLSSIICDNSKIDAMQKNAMLLPSESNLMVSCELQPKMDFSPWKDQEM